MEFSRNSMKKLLKQETTKRVSTSGAEELGEILEQFAGDIAEEAIAVAQSKDRKTVRAEDIKEAVK